MKPVKDKRKNYKHTRGYSNFINTPTETKAIEMERDKEGMRRRNNIESKSEFTGSTRFFRCCSIFQLINKYTG